MERLDVAKISQKFAVGNRTMPIVNVFDAKSPLSRLIEHIESGSEGKIIIARHGRPVARLVPAGGLAIR